MTSLLKGAFPSFDWSQPVFIPAINQLKVKRFAFGVSVCCLVWCRCCCFRRLRVRCAIVGCSKNTCVQVVAVIATEIFYCRCGDPVVVAVVVPALLLLMAIAIDAVVGTSSTVFHVAVVVLTDYGVCCYCGD